MFNVSILHILLFLLLQASSYKRKLTYSDIHKYHCSSAHEPFLASVPVPEKGTNLIQPEIGSGQVTLVLH